MEGTEETIGVQRFLWVEQNPKCDDFGHATSATSNVEHEVLVASFSGKVHFHEFQSAEFAARSKANEFDSGDGFDVVGVFGDESQSQKEFSETWVAKVCDGGFGRWIVWIGDVWGVGQFLQSWQAV